MHPVIFSIDQFELFGRLIGPFQIFSYGVFLAISFMAGLAVLTRDGKKYGLSVEDMMDMTIWIILFSIVGARIMYVALSPSEYAGDTLGMLMIYKGGLSFHGGAIGGTLAIFIFAARKKIPGWRLADAAVRPLIIGSAIARIGCFLNGCCYGKPWDGPWSVVFPVLRDGIRRHPTQFYDLTLQLVLFAAITYLSKFKKRDGDISAFYLIGFAILRFIVEIFRKGATGKVLMFGVTTAQFGSVAIIAGALLLYFRPGFNKAPEPAPAAAANAQKAAKQSGGNKGSSKKKKKGKGA